MSSLVGTHRDSRDGPSTKRPGRVPCGDATGVRADGHREVLGCAVGDSETEAFWTEFLRDLRGRGLHGVQLVVSE